MIKFNNFEVNSNTRELFCAGEKIQIQNKSLELLLYLIEHKDRAISKDELLDKLWDGRVVSESVLAHASTKLRAALKDKKGKGEIIRTVYGYGLQFVAELETQEQAKITSHSNPSLSSELSNKNPVIIIAAISFILISIITIKYYSINPSQNSTITTTQSIIQKPKINFIAIDSQDQKDQWLLQGLTLYLNQVLAYSNNSMPLPLEQMQNNFIDNNRFYAIDNVINTSQSANNLSLAFKQNDIVESELSVPLEDLPKAINMINKWACNSILKSNEKCEASISPLTVDNTYLIESYLRGKAAMFNQSPKDAIKFFEVTLQQDENFILARIALAQSYINISEYNKAISQAQTVISLTENILIQHQANIIIGRAYFRQSEFKQANQALNKVVESNQSHISLKAMALLIMAEVSMETEELNKSYEMAKLSNEILLKLDLPIMVARSLDVMGTIQMTIGDLKLAQQLLTDSLRIYEQLEYNSGMESVLSPLGLVMQSQGLLEASLAYGQQRQVIAEKNGDPIDIAGTHLHLANLLLEMGDYAEAMDHANKMWDIVILEDEPAAVLLAYFIAGEIAREDGRFQLSLDKYKHALDLAFELEIQFRQVQILCTLGATSIDAKLYDDAKSYLDKCNILANETKNQLFQVVVKLYLSQLYKDQGLIKKSKSVLNQALDLSKVMENDHLLWEIYLELFDHHIDTDVNQAETYLMNIPEGYKDDYVYRVNLARIEIKRNNITAALQILLEAKQVAKDNWTVDDQLLLKDTQAKVDK